jgi:hypothetical protein
MFQVAEEKPDIQHRRRRLYEPDFSQNVVSARQTSRGLLTLELICDLSVRTISSAEPSVLACIPTRKANGYVGRNGTERVAMQPHYSIYCHFSGMLYKVLILF